jgi:hypothetical protein
MFTIFVVVIAVGVFVMYFRGEQQRTRRLREAGPRPIADLPEDTPGRVAGIAQPPSEPLIAPFSGRPCVYYAASIERRSPMDPAALAATPLAADAGWLVLASETRSIAFVIQDETGRALIEPTAARVELDASASAPLDGASLTLRQREFLAQHQILEPGDSLRYREVAIAVGEAIAVFGSGTREPDPEAIPADYRGEPPTRLRLTSSAKHPLFISNPR